MIPSHFMIQSSHQVWSTAELPNFAWIQFGGYAAKASAASPIGRRLSANGAGTAGRAKLDSVKFGDEAGDQTVGLIESCIRLRFPLHALMTFVMCSIGLVLSCSSSGDFCREDSKINFLLIADEFILPPEAFLVNVQDQSDEKNQLHLRSFSQARLSLSVPKLKIPSTILEQSSQFDSRILWYQRGHYMTDDFSTVVSFLGFTFVVHVKTIVSFVFLMLWILCKKTCCF